MCSARGTLITSVRAWMMPATPLCCVQLWPMPRCTLPQGVEYYCRESENARYHFYINTTQSAVKVQVESGADLLSGKNVLGSMELKPYDACAIEEKVK